MKQAPALPSFDYQPIKYAGLSADEVLQLRKEFLNPGIFLYYKKPLMLVEGKMQYVWDEHGRRYLDALGGIVTVSVGLVIRVLSMSRSGKMKRCNIPRQFICIRT